MSQAKSREFHSEGGALALLGPYLNCTVKAFHNHFANGEAQAPAFRISVAVLIEVAEITKEFFNQVVWDPHTEVLHRNCVISFGLV